MTPNHDSDAVELRARLARLVNALRASQDQNPATIEALSRVFPENDKVFPPARRPLVAKIKSWLKPSKAA